MKLLPLCAALAAGEALALSMSLSSRTWPFFAIIAALTALHGFARQWRFWPLIAVFFTGIVLALTSSRSHETAMRDNPWMRNRRIVQRFTERDDLPSRIRKDLSGRAGIGLENRPALADINRAIILGERARLEYETKKSFVESGTMHVFAVSGFHVMIIAQTLLVILCMVAFPLRFAPLAALPVLWGYVSVIGFPPSAVRAATMAVFYFSAGVFHRKPDGLRAWALTFLLVHTLSPRMLFNVGNLLSFTVMLSILLWLRIAPPRLRTAGVTFAAWAGGLPIAARVFEQITPGGILANMIVMPIAGISVTGGALGVMSSYISKDLAAHMNNLAALASEAMVDISRLTSSLPFSCIEIPPWSIVDCFLWYFAMGLVYLLGHLKAKRRLSV